ncbi:hypothetical protein HZA55_07780 [Candidatus Poribacteria bacterium]|nr:hypothetical protein [Candidatus Poribacteria bacterium]
MKLKKSSQIRSINRVTALRGFTIVLFTVLFFQTTFANPIIFYKGLIDPLDKVYELDIASGSIVYLPNVENSFQRSNVVDDKFIFIKYDRLKASYVFYFYYVKKQSKDSKKFIFIFPQQEKITNIYLPEKQNAFFFATTNYTDKPNIVKVYKYSLNANVLVQIFQYEKPKTFNNIEQLVLLNDKELLIRIYQENKQSIIAVKVVDVTNAKINDELNITTDSLKVFSISPNNKYLIYHPNNGFDKSLDLALVHIYDFKNKKDLPLLQKKIKKAKTSVISQIIWAKDSSKLIYLEGQGDFDPVKREFILTKDNEIQVISLDSNNTIATICSSPKYYNILEVWDDFEKGFLCNVNNKNKDEYELVLIDYSGKIVKSFVKDRVVKVW